MTATKVRDQEALELAQEIGGSCVGVRVGQLHRLVSRRYEAALRPLGLTLVQMEILTGLTLVGAPVRPADIARALGVERSTMSRNLTLMENRGLVVTTEASASDRSLAVAISAGGTEKLVAARDAWTEAQQAVIAGTAADAPSTLDEWIEDLTGPSSGGRG